MRLADLRPIERRVLEYLDQRGPMHREQVVCDLASDDSKIGYRRQNSKSGRGWVGGSNGATPLIMGRWTARLVKAGLVKHVRSDDRYWQYKHHAITPAGRKLLRSEAVYVSGDTITNESRPL